MKQYYAVALLDPNNQHAVSDVIDPFWHAHILHTEQYIAFGERVFNQYVHHVPLNHADLNEVARIARLYAYTITVYNDMFSYVNSDFYPAALPDARLICFHADGMSEEVSCRALFPVKPELELAVA